MSVKSSSAFFLALPIVRTAFQSDAKSASDGFADWRVLRSRSDRLAVYLKGKNAKKYRHGMEYGSARWGTQKDIEPFEDPVFANNVILTAGRR